MAYDDLSVVFERQLTGFPLTWLRERGLTDSTIQQARLGYVGMDPPKGFGRYVGAITIPYLNPSGTVRSIRFRHLGHSKNKYDNLKGVKVHLYNVAATAKPCVWVCEGEFDSLVLTQLGYPSVGIPGAGSFKSEWKYLFANTDQVTLVLDSDEAGERGAQRLASILGDVVPSLRLARLPEGMDVNDLYLRDANRLKELVE